MTLPQSASRDLRYF